MKRALLLLLLAADCRQGPPRSAAPAATPTPRSAAVAATPTAPAGRSRGFGLGSSTPSPLSAKELAIAAGVEPEVTIPEELARRSVRTGALALFVDGRLEKELDGAAFAVETGLWGLVHRPARAILVHGKSNLWIAGDEAADYRLRQNRRGQLRLESLSPPDGARRDEGSHREDEGSHRNEVDRAGVRDVTWIEVRTPASPRLAGEPSS